MDLDNNMSTIRDVAKLAGVSVATVSRVLNGTAKVTEKTKASVLMAQKELGFYLNANARALANRDSETIGVVVADLSDPYFGLMIKSCENAAHKQGNSVIVSQGFHDEKREIRAIENMLSRRCRGIIVHALAINEEKLISYMNMMPQMVLINRTISGFENRCLNIDNFTGQRMIVTELLNNGHKRIAFVGSSHAIADSTERHEGYKQAILGAGIEYDKSLIVFKEPSLEGGAEAAVELLNRATNFTAIACYNDYMAAGVMSKLVEAKLKVPEDISVTGFDDLYLASCTNPPLTTIHQPIERMSYEAVNLSLSLHYNTPYHLPKFDTRIVRRKSVTVLGK